MGTTQHRDEAVAATAEEPLTIVVADDHAIVRSGIRALLDRRPEFGVVGEVADFAGALAAVSRHRPAVLLLDLDMPGGSGLPNIAKIRQLSLRTSVVVLTMHDDPALARRAIEAGASAYILKEAAPTELIRALLAVARGERYVQPTLAGRMLASPATEHPLERLTAREREVFARLVAGKTNRVIAEELHLSVRTVETHRARLQDKLGVAGLFELVQFARRHGLLAN